MAKKNKGPRVRHAKEGDRNLFRKLWKDYLTEGYESKDLPYQPTDYTLDRFTSFFDLYMSGQLEGIVLFVGDTAVLLAGALAMVFDEDCKYKAVCWGIYVAPKNRRKGYFKLLANEGLKLLKEKKFDTVVSGELKAGSIGELAAKTIAEPRSAIWTKLIA